MRSLKGTVVLSLVLFLIGAAAAQARTRTGYLTMRDGTQLKYTAQIPAGPGRFPVVFTFDGYDAGVTGGSEARVTGRAAQSVAHGYVALGANVPGTGCSTGNFTMFTPDWGVDGAQIVQWAARQPWSNGKVAMVGHSFGGFVTWEVAGQRPPALQAIAAAVTDGDFYRDAVFPGGIWNYGISEAFVAGQQDNAAQGVQAAVSGGDLQCARNYATHEAQDNFFGTTAWMTLQHQYDDPWWQLRAVDRYFPRIEVPVLATSVWQDGIAASGSLLNHLSALNPKTLWFIGGNGHHDEIDPIEAQLYQFFDHYLKRANNGWPATPHIQLRQDDVLPNSSAQRVAPTWRVDIRNWPIPVRPWELYLRPGHALSTQRPSAGESSDSYPYPRAAAGTFSNDSTPNHDIQQWKLPFDRSGAVAFTTAAFPRDAVVAGSGSLDLWLSSTATNTDLQATLTEVLPSGEEMFVQRGWLRASNRALDRSQSTPLLPVHPSRQSDQVTLVPGRPTFMRLAIDPLSVAIREGARLRLIIDAPTGATGVHLFNFLPDPAANTIYHDSRHPSVLRLGLMPGVSARAPLPVCDQDIGMPCRPDAFSDEATTHDPLVIPAPVKRRHHRRRHHHPRPHHS
jgi:hypothetical protein